MLNPPDIKDEVIIECLKNAYGLDVTTISFLPLGADFNTAVYRITTSSQTDYFLKLRHGQFYEGSVFVPKYLADLGVKQVIAPLSSNTGELWANLASFIAILYPYVEGSNGVEVNLSDQQWIEFGTFMKKFHSIDFPPNITSGIPQETFSSKYRETVKAFLLHIENNVFDESIAKKMALFLKSKKSEILKLVENAENFAITLQKYPLEKILCHADIHGWNIIIDKETALYIVDWDTLIFAPQERDLMFVGAGIWKSGRRPREEELLFYKGYGPTEVNQDAICYYRFERIIEDIGEFCKYIFLSNNGRDDRMQALEYLQSNFLPGGTIERAYQSLMRKMP